MNTFQLPRIFGLNIQHRPHNPDRRGSTWRIACAPDCPVVALAALASKFGLKAEQLDDGRIVLFAESPHALAPSIDNVESVARETWRNLVTRPPAPSRDNVVRLVTAKTGRPC